jgi:hypothetical protein
MLPIPEVQRVFSNSAKAKSHLHKGINLIRNNRLTHSLGPFNIIWLTKDA